MSKKRKVGFLLILIGIGIPLVLFFFQDDGDMNFGCPTYKVIERKLTPTEAKAIEEEISATNEWLKDLKNKKPLTENEYYIKFMLSELELDRLQKENINKSTWTIESKVKLVIPYKYFVGIGTTFILIGIGMIMFSFSPKKLKLKNDRD